MVQMHAGVTRPLLLLREGCRSAGLFILVQNSTSKKISFEKNSFKQFVSKPFNWMRKWGGGGGGIAGLDIAVSSRCNDVQNYCILAPVSCGDIQSCCNRVISEGCYSASCSSVITNWF